MADQITGILSPFLRSSRLKIVRKYCFGKVLDYGCGSGSFSVFIDKLDYAGVDTDKQSVERAKVKYADKSFYMFDDVEWRRINYYDAIVLSAVIEHLSRPEEVLLELKGYIRENGQIVITTPNPRFEFIHHIGALFGIFSKEASGEHCSKINFKNMGEIALSLGMDLVAKRYFLFGFNQCFVLKKRRI